MPEEKVIKAKNRLSNLKPYGVDLVDEGAIQKKFLIVKRNTEAGVTIEGGSPDPTKLPEAIIMKDAEPKEVAISDVTVNLNSLLGDLREKETVPAQVNDLIAQAREILAGEQSKDEDKEKKTESNAPVPGAVEPVKEVEATEAKDTEPAAESTPPAETPPASPESSTTPVVEVKAEGETVHPPESEVSTATDEEVTAYLQESLQAEMTAQELVAAIANG